MKHILTAIAFILATISNVQAKGLYKVELNDGWQFRQVRIGGWHKATVPGTVHTDLMAAGLLEDPFFGLNERKVQWVDKEDWEYKTTFMLNAEQKAKTNHRLVFDGLDNYADVYVNDSLVIKADNMFVRWTADVTKLLKEGENTLRVYLHSPIKIDMPKWMADKMRYPAQNDQCENGGLIDMKLSVYSRKAGYQYGWDWGPRLVTSGIWRKVRLESWNDSRIEDVYFRQSTTAKVSHIKEAVTITSDVEQNATIRVKDEDNGKTYGTQTVMLKKGENEVTLSFDIKNPKLWWTNGLGDAHLYNLVTTLETAETECDVNKTRLGLRSLRLLREKDSEGREFCFELNGKRVFMKGANYIPCDNFLTRVNDSVYAQTIKDAVDVNMNMLRVWGGGIYEDDRFYNLCDENGILIWQDFMFACSMYPSHGELLENIRNEARYNIKRLRNHPCMALWCGNNECQDAYYGWGWKKRLEDNFPDCVAQVKADFDNVYFNVLPEEVEALSPDICYTPSSPFAKKDAVSEANNGDFHYWGVWHQFEPIAKYNDVRARFFSEYGMQSFPEFESVKTFAPDSSQWDIRSDVMMSHQRGGEFANGRIEAYLESEYVKPDNFEDLLYVGQLMQGDAMKTAIEAHRRDKGYCWGTLVWQINDCWPVASWSTRDWYGRWKAAHYMMRHAMDDVLVSPIQKDDILNIYIVNDRLSNVKGKLTVQLMRVDGTVVKTITRSITAKANTSQIAYTVDKTELLGDVDARDVIVYAEFATDRTYTAVYAMEKPKNMHFTKANIKAEVVEKANGEKEVVLTSDAFVRGVFLSIPKAINPFADNYIDLLPGKSVSIGVKANITTEELKRELKINYLNKNY